MPRSRFVEIDMRAWKPLPENQRLDAYYMHCELSGAKQLRDEANEAQKQHQQDPTLLISAESLSELPATGQQFLAEHDLHQKSAPALLASPQSADVVAPPAEDIAARGVLVTQQPSETTADDPSSPMASSRKGRKKKRRPSTAHPSRRVVPTADDDATPRPQSAPARLVNRPPIKVYATHFEDEVRGPPDVPSARCEPKPGTRRGHHNTVISDEKENPSTMTRFSRVVPFASPDYHEPPAEQRIVSFTGAVLVTLASATPWATVRYTLDGGAVTRFSRIFRHAVEISSHVTLRARSCKRAWLSGEIEIQFVRKVDSKGVRERIMRASNTANLTKLLRRGDKLETTTPRDKTATALLEAIRRRNAVRVRKLLEAGVNPNEPVVDEDKRPCNLLVEACETGDAIIASLLLSHDAPATGAALLAACEARAHQCCRLLLSKGADVETPNAAGRRPLHVACEVGAARCADMLLKAGADVERSAPDGEQPLHTVCRSLGAMPSTAASPCHEKPDHSHCARLLVDGGAKLDSKYKNRRPIQYAVAANAPSVIKLLLDAGSKPLPIPKAKADNKSAARAPARGKARLATPGAHSAAKEKKKRA
ncbi:hypothetical protein CTAYLR_008932 [Chrysophaeum taylorii]|uniref:GH29D-like beta-sandwich domain-containing protein n=1 Tax=Chrysophaeum taylorii TaxID=2483200 RepID=A0AAD7XRC1_9STRA|nr:hypothetical protein CTAYLR_008932 [Chrysophaeum taylorii]